VYAGEGGGGRGGSRELDGWQLTPQHPHHAVLLIISVKRYALTSQDFCCSLGQLPMQHVLRVVCTP
jgi:hypothetical protein